MSGIVAIITAILSAIAGAALVYFLWCLPHSTALQHRIDQEEANALAEKVKFTADAAKKQAAIQSDLDTAREAAVDIQKQLDTARAAAAVANSQLQHYLKASTGQHQGSGLPAAGASGQREDPRADVYRDVADELNDYSQRCTDEVESLGATVRYLMSACAHGCVIGATQ